MKYNYTVVQDGQTYKAGEDVPDMGSLIATSVSGNIRSYEGLYADVNKLPKYDNLETGSSCFFVDVGYLYKYEATKKQWNKL